MTHAGGRPQASGAWVDAVVAWARAEGVGPGEAAMAAAASVARESGVHLDGLPAPVEGAPADPWVPGSVYERLLAAETRREQGAWFTPPGLAASLVRFTLEGRGGGAPRSVCDPAMGAGAFLLAAAEELVARGGSRHEAALALHGADIDPDAVAVARASVRIWAGGPVEGIDRRLVVGDTLAVGERCWAHRTGGFDLVVGNPPFLNQLGARTSRKGRHAEVARELLGGRAGGYADTAGLFLLRALTLAAPGGRVGLLQPLSLLAARDAAPVREALADQGLAGLWVATEQVFEAQVRVCAPVVEARSGRRDRIVLAQGAAFRPRGRVALPADPVRPWSPVLARVVSAPRPRVSPAGRVGDVATATAGFRDLFYALAEHVRPAGGGGDGLPVLTCGLVDPLRSRWDEVPCRLAGRRVLRPALPHDALGGMPPAVAGWIRERLAPKLLVATQTKVVEAVVDVEGRWVPCTPVIALHAPGDLLWKLAAVLASPPVAALALAGTAGSALSVDAIKLSARQLLELPLPAGERAWDEGAELARTAAAAGSPGERRAALEALGRAMCEAYGTDSGDLLPWWLARLPDRDGCHEPSSRPVSGLTKGPKRR